MGISFLFSFAFSFSSFLSICKASDIHFAFFISFSWGWSWTLVSYTMSRTSIHSSLGTLVPLIWNKGNWYLPFVGDFSSIKSPKILLYVLLGQNPKLHHCFLTASPLSLNSLHSLIRNYFKAFCAQEPRRVLLSFNRKCFH